MQVLAVGGKLQVLAVGGRSIHSHHTVYVTAAGCSSIFLLALKAYGNVHCVELRVLSGACAIVRNTRLQKRPRLQFSTAQLQTLIHCWAAKGLGKKMQNAGLELETHWNFGGWGFVAVTVFR